MIGHRCGRAAATSFKSRNRREVSGRAERRTPGGSMESSRLAARCLNSRAFALLLLLLTRRYRA